MNNINLYQERVRHVSKTNRWILINQPPNNTQNQKRRGRTRGGRERGTERERERGKERDRERERETRRGIQGAHPHAHKGLPHNHSLNRIWRTGPAEGRTMRRKTVPKKRNNNSKKQFSSLSLIYHATLYFDYDLRSPFVLWSICWLHMFAPSAQGLTDPY